jgi:signal peptidase I
MAGRGAAPSSVLPERCIHDKQAKKNAEGNCGREYDFPVDQPAGEAHELVRVWEMKVGVTASHGTSHSRFGPPMSAASTVSQVHFEPTLGSNRSHRPAHTTLESVLKNGSVSIAIHEGSMFPWFRSGDAVFVRRCEFESVSVGDVILFERGSELLLHRVIRRVSKEVTLGAGALLVTKGDAANYEDSPIVAKQLLGRAIRIHRRKHHIDLESLERKITSKIIARVSAWMPLVYRPLRAVKMLFA